jgi:DNA-binding CsgD family transcriptional regulator
MHSGILELVEAAVRTGRHTEAAAHVQALLDNDVASISTRLALVTHGAAAIAAPEGRDLGLFRHALALPDVARWPFDRARIQAIFGERLRRRRAVTDAREQLSAALDTFDYLGARPWALRAADELRASGLTKARAADGLPDPLTAQERKVASLAAEGYTNKQIGERLCLSPRTVGFHLNRVYPKLGINSRAALRDALSRLPAQGVDPVVDLGGAPPRASLTPIRAGARGRQVTTSGHSTEESRPLPGRR